MTYQVSIKDFKKAISEMKGNVAIVRCNEHMWASIQFLMRDDGTIYYAAQYTVENFCHVLGDNYPIDVLVNDFNQAMANYELFE